MLSVWFWPGQSESAAIPENSMGAFECAHVTLLLRGVIQVAGCFSSWHKPCFGGYLSLFICPVQEGLILSLSSWIQKMHFLSCCACHFKWVWTCLPFGSTWRPGSYQMGLISILIISGLFWSFEIVSGGIRFIAFSICFFLHWFEWHVEFSSDIIYGKVNLWVNRWFQCYFIPFLLLV